MSLNLDTVILRGLQHDLVVGPDAWERSGKAQPVNITIELTPLENFEAAALEDNVALTVDYGKLYKKINQSVFQQDFANAHQLLETLVNCMPSFRLLSIEISLPKSLLLAEGGISYSTKIIRDETTGQIQLYQRVNINRIICNCIIGVNPHERVNKQRLIVSLSLDQISNAITSVTDIEASLLISEYFLCTKEVIERIEGSSYQTIEALATAVAQIVTMKHGFMSATVRVDKPSAIATLEAASVQITRDKEFFENKDFWKVKRT